MPARRPRRAAMAATCAGNMGLPAWRPETLTDTPMAGSSCCCQAAVWRHACSSTCSPSSAIRPLSSAIGMNSSGETMPRSGCAQRTSASVETGRPGGQVDDRLVEDLELAALQRPAQLGLGPHAGHGAGAHRLVEQLVAPAAARLGAVHRRVGVAEQRRGRVGPRRGQGDARAHREEVLAAVEDQRPGHRGREPLGDLGDAAPRVDVGADHDELVAAQARDGVGHPHRGGQPRRQGEQHLVAGGVAEGVVDRLEAVEVEHEDRDVDALALPAGQGVSEAVERERAVGQPGERVVQRGMARDLLLAVALDGDDDQRGDGRSGSRPRPRRTRAARAHGR